MIAGLLLASGASRRFGADKLLARLGEHAVVYWAAAALSQAVDELFVVVAVDSSEMRDALAGLSERVIVNREAHVGLSRSIRAGVDALPPDVEAVVVALGDQPLLEREHVERVIARWRQGDASAVATHYADGRGHPVLFARSLFPALRKLEGDRGARTLLDALGDELAVVVVEDAQPIDVDTPDALDQVRAQLAGRPREGGT